MTAYKFNKSKKYFTNVSHLLKSNFTAPLSVILNKA